MDRPFSIGEVLVRGAVGLTVALIGVIALMGLASGTLSVASFGISVGLGPSVADASPGQAKKYCSRKKTKSKRRNCLKHWNPGPPLLASDISMHGGASCAVTLSGTVACWGDSYEYASGMPFRGKTKSLTHLPRELEGLDDISRVLVGRESGCALKRAGTVLCWIESSTPKEIPGLNDAVDIANGTAYWGDGFCAVREGGTVVCWGDPFTTDCEGYDGCIDSYGFDQVEEIPEISDAVRVFVSDAFSYCAITESESVFCWGTNGEGDFGNGLIGKDEWTYDPVNVPTLQGAKSLSLGTAFWGVSCVQFESDDAKCWGDSLLLNRRKNSYVPVSLSSLGKVREIVAPSFSSDHMVCAIRRSGRPVCWGNNQTGLFDYAPILGNGTLKTQYIPRRNVKGILDAVEIESFSLTACVIRATSQVLCWGDNSWRGLGLYANYQPTLPRVIRVPR